jgi:hypothetical protein
MAAEKQEIIDIFLQVDRYRSRGKMASASRPKMPPELALPSGQT